MNPFATIIDVIKTQGTCALVTITSAEGSTPRDEGAWMIVTRHGYHGTIGGGTVEWHAMAEAQNLLGKPATIKTVSKMLGPDLGQCCGGRMTLSIECFDPSSVPQLETRVTNFQTPLRPVHIWGAGHVGRALVMALAPLPFRISWWDSRPNAFPALVPQNVTCHTGHPQDMVDGGFLIIMTHSHALDFQLVDLALRDPKFAFVGLIGSDTKRARFISRLRAAGHDEAAIARLCCPIGSTIIKSKLPAAIAASVVVQLLEQDEALRHQTTTVMLAQAGISVSDQKQRFPLSRE
ncbi:MAG: xanthine dehydrogenase accessory protein XdhC [Alphaproteobacteria bacterium]|nr:xanthine dehydrogenase accessory protein XdhC [Alphaproteobacteria bacterium]